MPNSVDLILSKNIFISKILKELYYKLKKINNCNDIKSNIKQSEKVSGWNISEKKLRIKNIKALNYL